MPFPDESFADQVRVLTYQGNWAGEGAALVARLGQLMPDAVAVDHIGSTAVPGMAAKDCIDAMVRVRSLIDTDFRALVSEGFRERPESWNHEETLDAVNFPKSASHRQLEAGR